MTPHRDKELGTFIIDRRLRRIGRIKRASGTDDVETFAAIARPKTGMLDQLHRTGRMDLLIAIRDGELSAIEVYSRWSRSELHLLPTAAELVPIERFEQWARRAPTGEDNRASRILAAKALVKLSRPGATITELPNLLRVYRERCEHEKHRTFNLTRTHVEKFLGEQVGRAHRLYVEAAAVATLPITRRKGRPLSVPQFLEGVKRLDEAYAAIAWDLVTTGMGRKEYWDSVWREKMDRIEIHGTKRAGRQRVVPRLRGLSKPARLYPAFRRAFAEAFDGRTPYDLRRTFARWMQEAGVPRTRRRLYMGHGVKDVTDLYEGYEVTEFLREDAQRLQDLLGIARRGARTA